MELYKLLVNDNQSDKKQEKRCENLNFEITKSFKIVRDMYIKLITYNLINFIQKQNF